MLVVFVMNMGMLMFQALMHVPMLMPLGKMQPYPSPHEGGGSPKELTTPYSNRSASIGSSAAAFLAG